jgi:thioredoxin-related protein
MNSMWMILLSTFMLTNGGAQTNRSQNGELKWTNFTRGVKEAAATNKKVLIDVYTDWCGWCKKMDSDTYSDKGVQSYLNQNYVLVKLNAESSDKEMIDTTVATDAQIASAFGVSGYPTTVFLSSDGKPITAAPGYMKPDEFLQVLHYIGDDYYKKMEFPEYLKSQGVPTK